MSFELDDEKATDVLIWWVEGSDGSIDYREEEAVKKVIGDMNYSLDTFYADTLMHISGLSTEHVEELVNKSIEWGAEHFPDHRKQLTIALLENVAAANGDVTKDQREKIDKIKAKFGV